MWLRSTDIVVQLILQDILVVLGQQILLSSPSEKTRLWTPEQKTHLRSQVSSVNSRQYLRAGKGPHAFHPVFQKFPRYHQNSSCGCQIEDGSFSSFKESATRRSSRIKSYEVFCSEDKRHSSDVRFRSPSICILNCCLAATSASFRIFFFLPSSHFRAKKKKKKKKKKRKEKNQLHLFKR